MPFKDAKRCKAKSHRTGKQCRCAAVKGRDVCYSHGGASPQPGPGHHSYKNGNTSRFLQSMPARLASSAESVLAEPRALIDLSNNVALSIAQLEDILKQLDTGESGKAWSEIQRVYDDLSDAIKANENAKAMLLFAELGTWIKRGIAEYNARQEVVQQNMKTAELKRMLMNQMSEYEQIVTTKALTMFLQRLTELIAQRCLSHPDGRTLLDGIKRDITVLYGQAFPEPSGDSIKPNTDT